MAQATLNGMVTDDGGLTCSVRFQWGASREYGNNTPWQPGFSTGDTFSATITGLRPDTIYHFRAQAQSANGLANGQDLMFSTRGGELPMTLIGQELLDAVVEVV